MMKKEDVIKEVAKAQKIIEELYDNDISIDGFSKDDLFSLHAKLSDLTHGIIWSKEIEFY